MQDCLNFSQKQFCYQIILRCSNGLNSLKPNISMKTAMMNAYKVGVWVSGETFKIKFKRSLH